VRKQFAAATIGPAARSRRQPAAIWMHACSSAVRLGWSTAERQLSRRATLHSLQLASHANGTASASLGTPRGHASTQAPAPDVQHARARVRSPWHAVRWGAGEVCVTPRSLRPIFAAIACCWLAGGVGAVMLICRPGACRLAAVGACASCYDERQTPHCYDCALLQVGRGASSGSTEYFVAASASVARYWHQGGGVVCQAHVHA
jgi:hypothetical protein